MRGQFIRGDGLIIPNNVTLDGAAMILAAALRNTVPSFWYGLVTGNPLNTMVSTDIVEPAIGTNGYARIQVTRDATGWPTIATNGTEKLAQTKNLVWLPAGGNFDKPIQRLALFDAAGYSPTGKIYALSAPLPAAVVLGPATPAPQRTFVHQLYI